MTIADLPIPADQAAVDLVLTNPGPMEGTLRPVPLHFAWPQITEQLIPSVVALSIDGTDSTALIDSSNGPDTDRQGTELGGVQHRPHPDAPGAAP